MAKAIDRLSAEMVDAVGPGKYGDGNNLYLAVTEEGHRHWVFIYRWLDGKQVEVGGGKAIGKAGRGKSGVTLAQARSWAKQGRGMLNEKPKRDPRTVWSPTPARAARTFGEATASYIALKAPGWSPLHTQQWRNSLARYCEPINGLPIDKIDTAAVRAVLEKIWNVTPETAARVRNRIEIVINCARPDDDLRPNPARWRGHLDKKGFGKPKLLGKLDRKSGSGELVPRDNFAALPHAAAPAFARRLRAENSIAARALEYLLLCASRTSEVRFAVWPEIDLAAATWTVPAARLKVGKRVRQPHIVPLVGRSLAILEEMREISTGRYIFYGRSIDHPINDSAMLNVMKRLEPTATVHGCRSCFADYFGEKTSFSTELVEHQLGHVIGGVRAKYRRETGIEQRRVMLSIWDKFLAGEEQTAEIVPLIAARAS